MPAFIVSTPPDILPHPDLLSLTPESSIGISDIREVQRFLSRKPSQSQFADVVINSAHLMTPEAQNAALKLLEEPPGYARIYLVTTQPDLLLPTVISRCQVQSASPIHQGLTPSQDDFINKLITAPSITDKLLLLDSQSFTRETFGEFLTHLEVFSHHQVKKLQAPSYNLQLIYDLTKYLKANCSLRLILTHLSVHL